MKALVFEGKEKLALRSLAKPVIQADEVLLRIKSVGLCGTDLHIYHGGMKVPQDAVLGHEFSGVIEELGKNVSHLRVGDPVVAEHVVTCGKCTYCSRGKPNLCVVAEVIGVHRPGALAEYLALPASLVYPIPRSMSFDEAALIEPLSIALYAVREESFPLGKKVAVIGQGPIGLLIDQVLRLAGAFVVGIDVRDTTLQFAKEKHWVDHTINPEKESLAEAVKKLTEGGFDTVYEVVGKEETAEMSLEIARKSANIFYLGVFESPAKLDLMQIVRKELKVRGSWTCAFSFPEAIDLVAQKKVDLQSLITHAYSIAEGSKAFADASGYAGNRIKTIIRV